MITLNYATPWEVFWSCDNTADESWLVKQFTFKDLEDFQSKNRFGYFPSVTVVDTSNKRMTHGQVLHLVGLARADGRQVTVNDPTQRLGFESGPIPQDYLPGIGLRDYQRLAIQVAVGAGHGIVQAGTGAGKTTIMGGVVKALLAKGIDGIMIMIFSKDLINQTARRFIEYGVPSEDIGIVHSDIPPEVQAQEAKKRVVITTHLSIAKYSGTIQRTRYVICDEAHGATGNLWSAMFAVLPNMANVLGFTATPWDSDDEMHKMLAIFGCVLFNINVKFLVDRGYLMNPEIYFIKLAYKDRDNQLIAQMSWQAAEKQFIEQDTNRHLLTVAALKKFGGRMLVLFDRLDHGETVKDLFTKHGYEARLAEGSSSTKEREEAIIWFEEDLAPGQHGKVLLGSRIFSQGIDLKGGCDILFIIGATKKVRQVTQRLGRALRLNRSGRLLVFSVWDGNHPKLARWSGERKKIFTDLGFPVQVITLPEFAQLT